MSIAPASTATPQTAKSTRPPMFARWGRFTFRRRWFLLVASALLMVIGGMWGTGLFGSLSAAGFGDPNSESAVAASVLGADVPRTAADAVVVYSAPPGSGLTVDSPAFKAAVEQVGSSLPPSQVLAFTTYWNSGASPAFVNADHSATYAVVRLAGSTESERGDAYNAISEKLIADGLTTARGGSAPIGDSINTQIQSDLARAETISFIALGILLVVVFGSLASASLPLAIGGIAILGAFTTLRLLTYVTDVSVYALNIVTMLGLGLAIDYGLFMVSRFREQLARGDDVETAVANTMATAGRTVAFSGITVALSLGALLLFPLDFLRSMGLGGIAAVLVAMVAALTTMPALLSILGRRIDSGRMPWYRPGRGTDANGHGAWSRLAAAVMRRPIAVIVGTVALLLILGLPFLQVAFGGIDARALPAGNEARTATALAAQEFPALAADSISVVVRNADASSPAALQAYASRLGSLPDAQGATLTVPPSAATSNTALISVTFGGEAVDSGARQLVTDIRATSPPAGASVLVGGRTADLVDMLDSLANHLPLAAGYLFLATFILLFLAFGSIALPIKAIVMNVLSLSATLGVLVWGFQQGHLAGLLSFTSTGTLEATQPILIVALAFGLSMDYEVFLLSRIREEWDASGDNRRAVQLGLQRTGRIITSAALLFVVVIIAFSTSGITFIKMIGVGMSVAVIVDATIVRALLVPATMALLGRWNWWLPGPLLRLWNRIGVRETSNPAAMTISPAGVTGSSTDSEPAMASPA
ncbi:MAG: MMPL family transporter [Actinomycetes bacterium]